MPERISIIVPIYNSSKHLDRCLRSICNQMHKELEIILVDDGSTDQSLQICKHYAEEDNRVIICHQKHSGVSCARNRGLSIVTGNYVGFVDSDDEILPEMYEQLFQLLRKDGSDIACCGYQSIKNGVSNVMEMVDERCVEKNTALDLFLRKNSNGGYWTTVWNKLYRREIIFAQGRMISFDENVCIGEDERWLIQVLDYCEKISFTGKQMYRYIERQDSALGFLYGHRLEAIYDDVGSHFFTFDYVRKHNFSKEMIYRTAEHSFMRSYDWYSMCFREKKEFDHLIIEGYIKETVPFCKMKNVNTKIRFIKQLVKLRYMMHKKRSLESHF